MSGPGGLLRPALRWLSRALVEPALPLVALEVRPGALAAVRLAREGGRLSLAAAGTVALPPGTLAVSLTRPNVVDVEAFRSAARAVLERVGALAGGPISLVLPDPAVRLALVPSEGRSRDAEEAIRFRLHKALPFDVRGARLAHAPAGRDQVLVAVAPDEVVRGYEEALDGLGLEPGLVEPASLALLSALPPPPAEGDRLLVNWDEDYVSFVLTRAERPLLLRTLPGEGSPEAVARLATGTLQFHRDRLGGAGIAEAFLRSAAVPGAQAVAVLARALGLEPRLVMPWAALGIGEHGDEAQAVAGAAACVLRRAA